MTGKFRAGGIAVEEGRLDHQIAEVVYRLEGLPEWLMVSRVSAEYETGPAAIELISHPRHCMTSRQWRNPSARELYCMAYLNRTEPYIRFIRRRQHCVVRPKSKIEHILFECSNGFRQGINS